MADEKDSGEAKPAATSESSAPAKPKKAAAKKPKAKAAKKDAAKKPAAKKSAAKAKAKPKPKSKKEAAKKPTPKAAPKKAAKSAAQKGTAKSKRAPRPPGLDIGIAQLRESLEHSVTLSRERIQEVVDDAVKRGRMTHGDAEKMIGELLKKGRKQTDALLSELESLLRQARRKLP
jgi:outer membrane biosynthesis protein TonB